MMRILDAARAPRARTIALLLVAMIVVVGCKNPFATRDPEPPSGPSAPAFQALLGPSAVVADLRNGYNYRLTDYVTGLIDSTYRFSPQSADSLRRPDLFASWSVAQEAGFTRAVLGSDSVYLALTDDPSTPRQDGPTMSVWAFLYTLEVTSSAGSEPVVVHGRAILTFQPSSTDGLWRIMRWEDRADPLQPGAASWGGLRIIFQP